MSTVFENPNVDMSDDSEISPVTELQGTEYVFLARNNGGTWVPEKILTENLGFGPSKVSSGRYAASLTLVAMQNLSSSPITTIGAPGAGKYIDIQRATVRWFNDGVDFAGADGNLRLEYNTGSSLISQYDITTQTADNTYIVGKPNDYTPVENSAVRLRMLNDLTGGDTNAVATVVIEYDVVAFTFS